MNERDEKIVNYLSDAHGKERELEHVLEGHIEMTTKMPYKKRLRSHLTETRHHATALEKRIRQLDGDSALNDVSGVVSAAIGVTKAVAKVPADILSSTGEQETMLNNAKSEFAAEQSEIAAYTAIESFATQVGDEQTAKLARKILRDEERMAKFLDGQVTTLARAVAIEEVPAQQRTAAGRRAAAARA